MLTLIKNAFNQFKACLFWLVTFFVFLAGCSQNGNCVIPIYGTMSPYSDLCWYPDGTKLGFNHTPLTSVASNREGNCAPYYTYGFNYDSAGFWMVNRDGSNLRRVTNYFLQTPAWSPDGQWIAFVSGNQIFKMPFDGLNFDSSKIVQLTTDSSGHFFPNWNVTGDSIYFHSDEQNVHASYQVYKMAADGTGKTLIGNKGKDSSYSAEPFCVSPVQILNIRGDSVSTYVFTMDGSGNAVRQLTFNEGPFTIIHNPREYNAQIFYENHGIWSCNVDGSDLFMIIPSSITGFSMAKDGTIAYVNLDPYYGGPASVLGKTVGVIWLAKADGSGKSQLTYNNFSTN